MITWNIYHSTVEMYTKLFPDNVRIFRYEDLVADKHSFMRNLAAFVGVPYDKSMLYPSWNGENIENDIAPWGTVLRSTEEYNIKIIDELSKDEKDIIAASSKALAVHFGYDKVHYLQSLYSI
jgi:hypothetical protein